MGKKNKNKKKSKATEMMDGSEADAAAGLKAIPKEEAVVTNNKPTADDEEEEKHKLASKRARDKHKPSEEEPLSRRQKRQKLNEKNKWPQHPKIMNPERRAKAYLRVAGVEEINEDDTEIPVDKPTKKASDEDEDEWRRFGRFLGGTDARTRHKAVKRLGHYLQAKSGFGQEDISTVAGLSELDLMKLWKGLWYTLYMADKAPVQDELAKHLSKLLWCLTGSLEDDEGYGQAYLDWEAQEELEMEQQMALLSNKDEEDKDGDESDEDVKILDARYVAFEEEESADEEDEEEGKSSDDDQEDEEGSDGSENHEPEDEEDSYDENEKFFRGAPLVALMIKTFYKTLLREWGNMDKYRVDKFYALVRYMTREMYRYMATRQWNLGIIKIMNDTIVDEALAKPPNGVRYHLIDIALEELSRVVHKTDCLPLTEAIFLEIMEPFFQLAMHGAGDKTVQARAFENVLEKFLNEYSVVSEFDDEDRKLKEKQIFEEVHVGAVAQYIFDMASAEDTLHIHRKSLYDMHKTYKRQLQKVGKDVEIGAFKLDVEDAIMENGEEVHSDDEDNIMESESAEDIDPDPSDDNSEDEEEESPPSKKGKNKKQEKQALDGKDEASKNRKPESSNKKKGKKKTKDGKGSDAYEMQMNWTRHGDNKDVLGKGKETKKKKKYKNKTQEQDAKQEEVAEETVTISVSDQKKAKKALKKQQEQQQNKEADNEEKKTSSKSKKKDKKKKDKEKSNKEKDKKRRVSWDTKNQARSWKASMQGLKTMEPPKTLLASKTPGGSILLNKDKKSPSNTSAVTQKARKRATDYF